MRFENRSYRTFGLMIAVSTLLMYALMYLNTFQLDHIFFSQTRAWMAILMGATMAMVMLLFMWGMYHNKLVNWFILGSGALAFCLSLWLVRSQDTVSDVSYMEAMIPHHSIAILTSNRAHIKDPRVRKLADGILVAQIREIAEMKLLISELRRSPVTASAPDLAPRLQAMHF